MERTTDPGAVRMMQWRLFQILRIGFELGMVLGKLRWQKVGVLWDFRLLIDSFIHRSVDLVICLSIYVFIILSIYLVFLFGFTVRISSIYGVIYLSSDRRVKMHTPMDLSTCLPTYPPCLKNLVHPIGPIDYY